MGPETTITADALRKGDGGQVIVWADEATVFHGTITARGGGGSEGGDGGFVETSAGESLTVTGLVDAGALSGASGTWLLDPLNIMISPSGPFDPLPWDTDNPPMTQTWGRDDPPDNANINASIFQAAGSGVTIRLEARNDITIADNIVVDGDNVNVILKADNNINFRLPGTQLIDFLNTNSTLSMIADADGNSGGNIYINSRPGFELAQASNRISMGTGALTLKGWTIFLENTLDEQPILGSSGPVTITAADTLTVNGSITAGGDITIEGYNVSIANETVNPGLVSNGSITVDGRQLINVDATISAQKNVAFRVPTGRFQNQGRITSSQGNAMIEASNMEVGASINASAGQISIAARRGELESEIGPAELANLVTSTLVLQGRDLQINPNYDFSSFSSITLTSDGILNVNAPLIAPGNLTLDANDFFDPDVPVAGDIVVTANVNAQGFIQASADRSFTTAAGQAVSSRQGSITVNAGLGASEDGNITLGGNMTSASSLTLSTLNGSITTSGDGRVTPGGPLRVTAATGIDLKTANVRELAASTTASNLVINNNPASGPMTISEVNGQPGLLNQDGDISLSTSGALIIEEAVSAPSGTVQLQANAVSRASQGSIAAQNLVVHTVGTPEVPGSVDLSNATDVSNLAIGPAEGSEPPASVRISQPSALTIGVAEDGATTGVLAAGGVDIAVAGSLIINEQIQTRRGNLSLNASDITLDGTLFPGDIEVNAEIQADGSAVLQADRNITIAAPLAFPEQPSTQRVTLQAGDNITVNASTRTSGAPLWLEANSVHQAFGASSGIGSVTVNAPVATNGGDITVIGTGPLQINDSLDAGGGTIRYNPPGAFPMQVDVNAALLGNARTSGQLILGQANSAGIDGLGTASETHSATTMTVGGGMVSSEIGSLALFATEGVTFEGNLQTNQPFSINTTGGAVLGQDTTLTLGGRLQIAADAGIDLATANLSTVTATTTTGNVTLRNTSGGRTTTILGSNGQPGLSAPAGLVSVSTDGPLVVGTPGNDGAVGVTGQDIVFDVDGGMTVNEQIQGTAPGTVVLDVGGELVLNSQISDPGPGDAIVIRTGSLRNNFGPDALNPNALDPTGDGRFLVYSQDPANDVRGGLITNSQKRYGRTFDADRPLSLVGPDFSGNLFLYPVQPTLTISANDVSRRQGQGNPVPNVRFLGLIDGDNVADAVTLQDPLISFAADRNTRANVFRNGVTVNRDNVRGTPLNYILGFDDGDLTVEPNPEMLRRPDAGTDVPDLPALVQPPVFVVSPTQEGSLNMDLLYSNDGERPLWGFLTSVGPLIPACAPDEDPEEDKCREVEPE